MLHARGRRGADGAARPRQIIIALVLLSLGFVIFLIICKGFKCVS